MTNTAYAAITCGAMPSLVGERGARPDGDAWMARWDDPHAAAAALADLRRGDYEFHTSGSTGTPKTWLHSGEALCANADALLGAMDREFDAVVSFAPPRHIFGACATVALPAVLGVPLYFWGGISCPPPVVRGDRLLVVAIPWTFTLLHRQLTWIRSFTQVTFLHSTAVLPASARALRDELLDEQAAPGRPELFEVLGSTETGAVAYHSGWDSAAAWRLFPGVTFDPQAPRGTDGPLVVTSPWQARGADGDTPSSWATGDLVEIVDDSRFELRGRIGRLVKINGRRHDLQHIEEELKSKVACADVACLLVADAIRGESFDVLIAGGSEGAEQSAQAALRPLGLAARRIELVEEIRRSETGKVLADQSERSGS